MLSDFRGRKPLIIIAISASLVCNLLQITATTTAPLYAAALLQGTTQTVSMVSLVYLADTVPSRVLGEQMALMRGLR